MNRVGAKLFTETSSNILVESVWAKPEPDDSKNHATTKGETFDKKHFTEMLNY
jgi:hypothetical protein